MWCSVREIGNRRERISTKRRDVKVFDNKDFYIFAEKNAAKYQLIFEHGVFKVNTWNSTSLIEDYIKTIN